MERTSMTKNPEQIDHSEFISVYIQFLATNFFVETVDIYLNYSTKIREASCTGYKDMSCASVGDPVLAGCGTVT